MKGAAKFPGTLSEIPLFQREKIYLLLPLKKGGWEGFLEILFRWLK